MAELTPVPAEQRRAYYDALLAGRAEAQRLGVHLIDDRIFLAFHRALYRPMLDAHEAAVREQVARELLAAGRDPHRNLAWMYPEQAAAIARGTDTTATNEESA